MDNDTTSFRRRSSAFTEIGLEGHDPIVDEKMRLQRPRLSVRFRSDVSIVEPTANTSITDSESTTQATPSQTPVVPQTSLLSHMSLFQYLLLLAIVALAFPRFIGPKSSSNMVPVMADASPVAHPSDIVAKRQTASTDVCKRWAGQSALVNGTLYYYGGRATTSPDQTTNEWNLPCCPSDDFVLTTIDNDLITLDMTKSWQISSPSLTGLPIPSGPPAVSLGTLWSSTDSLYLYGGEFSDSPMTSPVPFSLWSYDISSSSWSEHQNPEFANGSPVQRAAEGAGVSVPGEGLGFYFGGHLDGYTTPGWSQSIARVYLPSMLEFTMPGYGGAGSDGSYRNITVGSAGFPERADGVLVYIPGYGKSGIIVGLAGGTNQTFTQMNILDVYDIDSATWYKQATGGPTPDVRVNPCAVAASSADGTSTQIYMFGGQNLTPYGSQTQYNDMWILTIPSFTWIQVDTAQQSVPPARAGHTCNIWNAQMVVVGGYVGEELSCDSPGIYVFNASSLQWQSSYTALSDGDPLNRQKSQDNDPNAIQGSFGYQVPEAVISVIGGNAVGSATVTGPAQTPLGGPLATGSAATYTVTGTDGSTVTQTSVSSSGGNSATSRSGGGGPNVGAIVAGVVAGLLFLMVLYLAFCTFIYRKQLKLYKNHVAMAQRDALTNDVNRYGPGLMGVASRGRNGSSEKTGNVSNSDRFSSDNRSGNTGGPGSSGPGSSGPRRNDLASNNPYNNVPGGTGFATAASSTEDLLKGQEPSFLGVMLNPRRSLRVVNKD